MNDPYARSSRFYNPIVEPWLRSIKNRIVQECVRLNLSRILDVGCGTGTLVGMLRKEGVHAVGVDPSPGMLRVSRGNSQGLFALVRGRGERLPFSSGSFQGVVFSMVIHENPPSRRRELLEDALRVLDSRGTLFILDYCKPSTASGQAAKMIEYLVEWAMGGEHFRNYRQFMEEGALPGFLAHIPKERIYWESAFRGSMSIARYHPEGFYLGGKDWVAR
jgi:ubiquinone/menaquinone biosynthesis C-methylase UbiE